MTGLNHGWDKDETLNHADFIHGGVDENDFADTTKYRKKAVKKSKRFRGCPENDGGPHVYVWTTESSSDWARMWEEEFFASRGIHRREFQVCCGCRKQGKSRYTEEFQKLISKRGWYQANYGD